MHLFYLSNLGEDILIYYTKIRVEGEQEQNPFHKTQVHQSGNRFAGKK